MVEKPAKRRVGLHAVPQIESDTFPKWLHNHRKRAKAVLGTLVAIPGLTFLLGLLAREFIPAVEPHIETIVLYILFIQFGVVFCLYWLIPRHPQVEESASASRADSLPRAARAAKRFGDAWGYAWLCWAVVYFGLGLSMQFKLWYPLADPWLTDPLKNLLNNIQTIFFLMCYRELRYPTDENQRNPLFALLSVPLFLAVIEVVLLAPGNPVRDTLGSPVGSLLGWVSGFAGGAAIALLVGRLESKFIDPPVWLIGLLYLYAAIQGAHRVLTVDHYVTLILVSLAFFSKIMFFLFVAWLLQSGVLMYYLTEVKEVDEKAPRERRSFLARLSGAHSSRRPTQAAQPDGSTAG